MTALPFAYDDGGRTAAGYTGGAGDCAARAAAIATGLPYQKMYDAINEAAKRERPRGRKRRSNARNGVWPRTLGAVLKEHGWSWTHTMNIGSGTVVHLRAEDLPPTRLIARVSKHFTAVVDGVIRDTHDPGRAGNRAVYGVWTPEPWTWFPFDAHDLSRGVIWEKA